jgi:hypothetical protein
MRLNAGGVTVGDLDAVKTNPEDENDDELISCLSLMNSEDKKSRVK